MSSSQKSRAEKLTEMYVDGSEHDYSDEEREALHKSNEFLVEKENEDLWAVYRALDVSQKETLDIVSLMTDPSQSTVSRVIRETDKEVLTDPEAVQVGGSFKTEDLEPYPEEWLEAYRQTVAEAHTDLLALTKIVDVRETPEWAARRFPELVGVHKGVAEKQGWDGEIADDSRLNHLDSVNTERWE